MGKNDDYASLESTENKPPMSSKIEFLGVMAEGGMATVYKAKLLLLERLVAVKVPKCNVNDAPDYLKRFRNEGRTVGALHHPNIVEILYVDEDENTSLPFIVMELLEGLTLKQIFASGEKFSRERFEEVFLPVMDALAFAHSKQVVHRDLKPENIMVCQAEGKEKQLQIKILDFGIAKSFLSKAQDGTIASHKLIGSPTYMSPEQCKGHAVDFRSDIYSLACTMYEALSGKPPYSGATPMETMYDHINSATPQMETISQCQEISRKLVAVIMKALSKDPADRPQTMEEFSASIVSALDSGSVVKKKRPWKLAKVVVPVLVLFFVIIILVSMRMISNHSTVISQSNPLRSGNNNSASHSHRRASAADVERYLKQGKKELALAGAKDLLKQALKSQSTDSQEDLYDSYMRLGVAFAACEQWSGAEDSYRKAFELYPAGADRRLEAANQLSAVFAAEHRAGDAISILDRSAIEAQKKIGQSTGNIGTLFLRKAHLLCKFHRYQEALNAVKVAQKILGHGNPADKLEADWMYYELTESRNGNPPEQGSIFERLKKENLPDDSIIDKAAVKVRLASLASKCKLYDLVEPLCQEALKELENCIESGAETLTIYAKDNIVFAKNLKAQSRPADDKLQGLSYLE